MVTILPSAADRLTSLALLFHEYATNAVKYGALSASEGRLDITLTPEPGSFQIEWLESNTTPATASESKGEGFGTTLEKDVDTRLECRGVQGVARAWASDQALSSARRIRGSSSHKAGAIAFAVEPIQSNLILTIAAKIGRSRQRKPCFTAALRSGYVSVRQRRRF